MKFPFLLLLLIPQSLAIKKMIQIYGKVTYGPFPVAALSSENCASRCFNLDYCILSWQTSNGSCYHYSYLDRPDTITVVETDKTENSKVGFKTIITGNDCPSSYAYMDFKMIISNGDSYSWAKSGNSWSLNGCRDGWKRFDRTDGTSVCMETFYSPGTPQWVAGDTCVVFGTDLIGVASVEESKWIHDQMMQHNPSKIEPFAFWTGGEFKSYNCANFCESIDWQDGYTKGIAALNTSSNFDCKCGGGICLTVSYFPDNTTKTMINVGCSWEGDGYVCGYDLKKSV